MSYVAQSNGYVLNVDTDSSAIRVSNPNIKIDKTQEDKNNRSKKVIKLGIVSILPTVQVGLGIKLDDFLHALEATNQPIAMRKTFENGKCINYDIYRLASGVLQQRRLAAIHVINDIIVGVTYNKNLVADTEFRKLIQLSAFHQLALCKFGDEKAVDKAIDAVSAITGINKTILTVSRSARSIIVKVNPQKCGIKANGDIYSILPTHHIFTLNKQNMYVFTQIAYDFNAAYDFLNNNAL